MAAPGHAVPDHSDPRCMPYVENVIGFTAAAVADCLDALNEKLPFSSTGSKKVSIARPSIIEQRFLRPTAPITVSIVIPCGGGVPVAQP